MAAAGGSWKAGKFMADPVPYVDIHEVERAMNSGIVPIIPANIASADKPLVRSGGQQELYRANGVWWTRFPQNANPFWIRSDPRSNAQRTMGYARRTA